MAPVVGVVEAVKEQLTGGMMFPKMLLLLLLLLLLLNSEHSCVISYLLRLTARALVLGRCGSAAG